MIKVLIVDDRPIVQRLIMEMVDIAASDCNVFPPVFPHKFTAINGEQGLQILKDEKEFDLLITDVRMDLMDGITMIREARKTGAVIMNIFIASSEELNEDLLRELGVTGYFRKPNLFGMIEAIKTIKRGNING